MTVSRLLTAAGLFVIVDSQSKHRKSDPPTKIIVSYFDNEDILETVAQAASVYPAPVVLILSNGQVMILANVSKGGIALQGQEGQMTEAQAVSFGVVSDVLCKHFEVNMAGSPKKRSRTASTQTVTETTSQETPDAPETQETGTESVSEDVTD